MAMTDDAAVAWTPPGPGPWQQDSAHTPVSQTAAMRALYPAGFNRGFTETFARYGVLLDRIAMETVNGFAYHQPQPFDMPGPAGPLSPEEAGTEIARRSEVAAAAFASKRWREDLTAWDTQRKPASIRRHRELGDVVLGELDTEGLTAHLLACGEHVEAMVYQHHRHNMAALLPVGDFLLRAGGLVGRPPATLMSLLDGYSPVSGIVSPEMVPVLDALREHQAAREALVGDGDPAQRLSALRDLSPEVDEYVRAVGFRIIEGFDVVNPTQGEEPEILLGKLLAALDVDPDAARRRADALAEELRAGLVGDDLRTFDELLHEARLVYRLRDERGLYSDVSAIGLLRLALLEAGRRLEATGAVHEPADALEATVEETVALLLGAPGPTAGELAERGVLRRALTTAGAPRFLGPPPPSPPPLDQLPPPLARLMAATGFLIDGVLGEMEAPAGEGASIIGIPAAAGVVEGTARLIRSPDDLGRLQDDDVLVAPATGEAINAVLHLLSAIVTDHGSFASHAAIVSRELGIPAVVGTVNATSRVSDGQRVRVDGSAGVVTLL
jgi:rifampicin phosphotransferase